MRALALLAGLLLASPPAWAEPAVDAAPPALRDATVAGIPVQERLAEIQQRVQAALRYPESARARGVAGVARVGFEIDAEGQPLNVALLASSGSVALDRAAQRAVREAGPLPPVLGRVQIPVQFRLAGDEAD